MSDLFWGLTALCAIGCPVALSGMFIVPSASAVLGPVGIASMIAVLVFGTIARGLS